MKRALAAAGLIALWAVVASRIGRFPFDDTYITLRYAENLAFHGHLSFNLDDRIDGFTSPGWTLLMALVVRLGFDGERAATFLSQAFGLGGVLLSALLALRLGASWIAALAVAGVGTMTMAGWFVWAACGMETPFVGVCVLALLLSYTGGRAASCPRAVSLLVAAAARPECLVLVGIFVLHDGRLLFAASRAERGRGSSEAASPPRMPAVAEHEGRGRWLAVVGILVAGFLAHWLYYGKPLPNTYYAKLAGPAPLKRGIEDATKFVRMHGVGIAVLSSLYVAAVAARVRVVALAFFAWASATFVAYAMAGGDYLDFHRFYQPLVPAAFAMLAAALRWPWHATIDRRVAPALAAAVGVALAADGAPAIRKARGSPMIGSAASYATRWRKAGEALARAYPPSTSMAVRPAGVIPYLTRFRTFDQLGLNTREIALHAEIVRDNDPGHGKEASPRQVVAWKPDIIVGHPMFRDKDESGQPPNGTPIPFTAAGYQFRCVPVEKGSWVCVYERPK